MTETTRVIIVGSGFSGIGLGCYLQKAGIDDFLLLEKAQEVGGTWRENTYPGAECDVPSALYSFSFEHNAAWQYKWAEQKQILAYLKGVAQRHGLYQRCRFGVAVESAVWDASVSLWRVRATDGREFTAQFLVSGVGQLHYPSVPSIEGEEAFGGARFHSAQWRHDVNLAGKRVAVIGNAASALQFIPQIAKVARQVTVFQRSANWVLPKQDRPYRPWEQWLSDRLPWLTRLYRLRIWLLGEIFLFGIMRGNPLMCWYARRENRRYLERTIVDPSLREKLIPDYPVGAKRLLFSDDYYAALARANVELVTTPIQRLAPSAVVCKDGREVGADVVVYGTGFRTNPFLATINIAGTAGQRLHDKWRNGAYAYLGLTTSGFPNFFMMYGPNTNLGSNSIVVMIEAQARYIVECIGELDRRGQRTIELMPDVEREFNAEMQTRLSSMAWAKIEASWYKDGDRITNNWAGSTYEYIQRCRHVDWAAYQSA